MNTFPDLTPVIIVGGGPVGFATALGLAHHGVHSILVEKDADPVRESRAFGIWARTAEALRDWGLAADLLAEGLLYRTLAPVNRTEQRLFTFSFAALAEISPLPGALILPQNKTEAILRRHVAQSGLCDVRIAECTGLELRPDRVGVHLRAADGQEATLWSQFVVAADGAHSTIRKALGLELRGKTYPYRMVLSDEVIDEQGRGELRFDTAHAGFLAAVHYGPNLWRVMGTVPAAMSDDVATSPEQQAERVRNLFGDVEHRTIWASLFRIHQRHIDRFRLGRLLFAGDATHLNSPAGGLGMNGGIQDAENLAWKLAYALQGGDVERLLDAYDAERRGVFESYTGAVSERNTQLEFGMPSWLKPTIMQAVDWLVKLKPVNRAAARSFSMLDVRYKNSPLLEPTHRLVGQRLDDYQVQGEKRLSDLLGGKAGILVTQASGLSEVIQGTPVIALTSFPRAWDIEESYALVVRPDRYVGAVVANVTTDAIIYAVQGALGRM